MNCSFMKSAPEHRTCKVRESILYRSHLQARYGLKRFDLIRLCIAPSFIENVRQRRNIKRRQFWYFFLVFSMANLRYGAPGVKL